MMEPCRPDEVVEDSRGAARVFLEGLHSRLKGRIPDPKELRETVAGMVKGARNSPRNRHSAFPEGAFLNRYIYPCLHDYLVETFAGDKDRATRAFLCESWGSLGGVACGTPARRVRHPFSKAVGNAQEIISQWRGKRPLVQSCPDFALRSPHKIVFEAKYFQTGKQRAAASALVEGIYQAFFYRGLPVLPEKEKRPAWDYDYACLLAADATEEGYLFKAWRELDSAVQYGCWDGANVFVMILRRGAT